MVLDFSALPLVVLAIASGGLAGLASHQLASSLLKHRLYSLECDVADVQERLLTEVKRRGGAESAKSRKIDQELLQAAQTTTTAPPQPWWSPFVHPDLKK
jgi:hypothetical protein